MQELEVRRLFDASRDELWDQYTDHVSWADWAGVGNVWLDRAGRDEPNGVGCVRVIANPGVTVREEITEFEPPRRMVYRIVSGPVPLRNHRGEVLFEQRGDQTEIVWRCQFEPTVPLTGGLMRRGVTKTFEHILARLDRSLR